MTPVLLGTGDLGKSAFQALLGNPSKKRHQLGSPLGSGLKIAPLDKQTGFVCSVFKKKNKKDPQSSPVLALLSSVCQHNVLFLLFLLLG